jgi:anti-sigma factor RsiW
MKQHFTEEQLILMAYGELNAEDRLRLERAMSTDLGLRDQYYKILQSKKLLNAINEEPHPTSVAIIIEHSHDSHTEAV